MLARKILVLMLVLAVAAFASGCGGSKSADEPVAAPEPAETPPPVEEPAPTKPVEPAPMAKPVLNDVFFGFDKYNLTGESKGILESNAAQLRTASDSRIVIEGHCDERGTKSYNLALGEKRANAARDYLVSLGISGSRITVVSYGKERPFDTGHSEAAWAKNRRAHFVVK